MNISHLPKAAVLAALYNGSKALGMGVFQAMSGDMTEEEAQRLLEQGANFDYLYGRVMKIDLSKDELETWLYNRDIGPGAAERIIAELEKTLKVNI